jgi:hypothetical protein
MPTSPITVVSSLIHCTWSAIASRRATFDHTDRVRGQRRRRAHTRRRRPAKIVENPKSYGCDFHLRVPSGIFVLLIVKRE